MNKCTKHNISNKAFSVIELSAVLVIIAIVAGSALSVGITQNESIKVRETDLKIERIEKAITAFVALNKRLPCPANASLALNDDSLGIESINSNECDATNLEGNTDYSMGTIPVKALSIPTEFMFDGWGRRFTYVVDNDFASSSTNNNFVTNDAGSIIVRSNNTNRTNQAVYVLISHGADGKESWPRNGGNRTSTADGATEAEEISNSHVNTTPAFDNIFVMMSQTDFFDDTVIFKTKEILLLEAGKLFSHPSCDTAENIINGGEECDVTINPDRCKSLAIVFNEMCL